MKPKSLQSIGDNLLPAIAYGDALGLPVEKKTREEIKALYGEIRALEDITSNPFLGEYPAGTTSDDTQLTVVCAESIIKRGEISIGDIAERHVVAMGESDLGWGGSTRNSMKRLAEGVDFRESGEPEGKGNGVLMKMAPLSFLIHKDYGRSGDPSRGLELFTRMTHDNDLSVVVTLTHNDVCEGLMSDRLAPQEVPEFSAFTARRFERRYAGAADVVSGMLGRLAALDSIDADAIIELTPKGGFYAPETLVMAYGSFAVSAVFPESAFAAVNLGGDADSVASIVSAMSIMHEPNVEWPEDIDRVKDIDMLRRLSKRLTNYTPSQWRR